MGREIRRVPKGWEHPRYTKEDAKYENWVGNYRPLYNEDFETAKAEWKAGFMAWEDGTHEDLKVNPKLKAEFEYWTWHGNPPEREYYRPKWTPEDMTCYQVYETVSEGTPTSPVFETQEELIQWLVGQGHSEKAARAFVKDEWVPSLMVMPGVGIVSDINIAEHMSKEKA